MTEPEAQPDPSEAEELFIAFLSRHLPNCPSDAFERLVEAHAELEDELRDLRDRWTNDVASLLGSRHSIDQFKLDQILAPSGGAPVPPIEPGSMPLDLGATDEHGEAARLLDRLAERPSPLLRYDMDGQIAQGGMGVIHRIWDKDLRRFVVMKVMKPRPDHGPTASGTNGSASHGPRGVPPAEGGPGSSGTIDEGGRRFLDEAWVTAQLDHPGIVPVHELGRDEQGRLFFTMKLVKGLDFKTVIDRVHSGEVGLNRAVGNLRRVAEAVAYAHSKNVLHRDIKPQNIMVGRFGETYLMDWGLARRGDEVMRAPSVDQAVEDAPPGSAHVQDADVLAPDSWLFTRDGKVLGTPPYMSPEQARGEIAAVDARSDVYSVGAILYHLLSGRIPYVEEDELPIPFLVLMRVKREPPRPLAELAPDAPPTLLEITARAMARDPADRYASAAELAAALADYLEDISEAREEARRQAERAQLVNQFLIDMLGWADPANARGVDMTVSELVDRAAAGIDSAFPGHPVNEAVIRSTIGNIYRQLGRYDDAAEHLDRARDLDVRSLGDEHPDTLLVTNELALLRRYQGRFEESEQMLRSTLGIQLRHDGSDHLATARTRHLLAAVLQRTGDRLEEAEELFRVVLATRQALLPADHPDTLTTMMGLSQVLQARGGRLEETETLRRHALAGLRRVHGENHPLTLSVMSDLVTLLRDRGRMQAAAELARRTLAGQQQVLGEDHPNVLLARNNLGFMLRELGELDQAEEQLQRAMAGQRRSLGGDHMHTLSSTHNLALVHERQGRLAEAERLCAEVVEVVSRGRHSDSGEAARFRFNHGRLLLAMGRETEGRAQVEASLAAMTPILDPEHPWIAEARATLDQAG